MAFLARTAEQGAQPMVGALPPPPGVTPNFENPPNANWKAEIVLAINLVIICVLAIIRAWSRIFIVKRIRIEDVFGLIGFMGQLGFICMQYRYFRVGFFVNAWNVRADMMPQFLRDVNITSCFNNIAVGPMKMAILKEWSHIFVPPKTRNAFWWICHVLIAINLCFYISGLCIGIFGCVPREYTWNKDLPGGGHCVNSRANDLASSCINLILDIAILLLPQRAVWKLNMPFRRKIGVAFLFGVGIICCSIASVRMKVTIDWLKANDVTFWVVVVTLWAATEATCLTMVFCIPAVPKVLGSMSLGSLRSFSAWTPLMAEPTSRKRTRRGETDGSSSKRDPALRPADEMGIALQHVDIARVPTAHSAKKLHGHGLGPEDSSIMATTRFTVEEDYIAGDGTKGSSLV